MMGELSFMRYGTSNPILSSKYFSGASSGETTTLAGTINRCLILLSLVLVSGAFAWINPGGSESAVSGRIALFVILGLVTCIVTCVKREWAGVTAPLYAVFEGLVLGSFSRLCEAVWPGIVFQAMVLTLGVAFGMLILYRTGVIRVSDTFRAIIGAALFGIFALYMVSWILSFFGIAVPLINSAGPFGIALSVFVVAIAALSLVSDFDFIVQTSDRGLPVYMSWFAAFGMTVTLIWLYMEILRLLSKIRSRD
jgi:uncharacterized YccA/Bax inhibitor family protein